MRFDPRGGIVLFPVSVRGEPGAPWFLDSGFGYSVMAARTAAALGIEVRDQSRVTAPGGSVDRGWIDRICLAIGSIRFCADSMARIPLEGLEPVVAQTVAGILGHDFFERFVVRIDYRSGRVELYEPDGYLPPKGATAVPVFLEGREPFVVGTLFVAGRAHPAKLKVDTGSLDFMGLNGSYVAQTRLLPAGHQRAPAPGIAVGGQTENWVTRLDSVAIAGFTIADPPIGYSTDLERAGDAGTIGARFLSRFVVTFDYRRRRLWLEPAVRPTDPVGSDASGTIIVGVAPDWRGAVVAAVAPGGPADRAGLEPGDTILQFDGRAADSIDLFELRRELERPGVTHRLTVRRGTSNDSLELRTAVRP